MKTSDKEAWKSVITSPDGCWRYYGLILGQWKRTRKLLFRVEGLGLGLYRDNGKENGNYYSMSGEKENMETTMVYWGYTGVVENKMETTGIIEGYEHFRFQYGVCGIVVM